MKGISKSLFASQARVRSAMADAAQASMDTLGYARGDSAAARDAEAVASAFRRGDDGACDPDASLVLVLEHAVGFDEPCLFLAARVANVEHFPTRATGATQRDVKDVDKAARCLIDWAIVMEESGTSLAPLFGGDHAPWAQNHRL